MLKVLSIFLHLNFYDFITSALIVYFKNLVSLSTLRKPVEVWPLQLEYSDESLRHNKDEGGKHKSGVYAIVTWW